jgi:hypothetical protein
MHRLHKEVIRAIKKTGATFEVEENSNVKVFGTLNGHGFFICMALTPSDVRAEKNIWAEVRRRIRACGGEVARA